MIVIGGGQVPATSQNARSDFAIRSSARCPPCVVRVVHSLFASSDDWDVQLESLDSGWPRFFGILRLYLTHFRGQNCSTIHVMGSAAGPESKVWDTLTGALGLAGATEGQRWNTLSSGVLPLAGIVERTGERNNLHVLLRLDDLAPGIASPSAFTMGDQVHVGISFYLYSDRASAVVARDEHLWQM